MGFWDKAFDLLKNTGAAVYTHIEQSANEAREIKLKYEELDDEELLRIVHSTGFLGKSQKEKAIAFSILKSRGINVDEINARKS